MKKVVTSEEDFVRKVLPYLDEKKVSEITGMSLSCLRNWRHLGKGPAYVKPGQGRAIRYRLDDVLAFMESGRIDPEASR